MHIKPFYRLRPADLPLVESPFLASQTLRRILSDPLLGHSSLILDELPGMLPGTPREVMHQHLISRVATGELCLVHTGIGSDRPMSPVVSWRPDHRDDRRGAWHCEITARDIKGVEHAVAELNRKGLIPSDLRRGEGIGFGNDQGSPAESEFNGGRQQEITDHRLTLPLGASASVQPLATEAKSSASESKREGVHLVVGLFTDGTLNNADNIEIFREKLIEECIDPVKKDPERLEECRTRLAMRLGESYANGPTNVVKLFDLYREQKKIQEGHKTLTIKAYEPGAGTKSGKEDSILGAATGLGETGVPEQVKRLFRTIAEIAKVRLGGESVSELTVDLFGFSRGAAAARHAAQQILKGADGQLANAFRSQALNWPDTVNVRFVGLFDTVAGIVNFSNLDLSAGNDNNNPVELYLDPDKVGHVVHLVAADEKRANFALNSVKSTDGSLPDNFREIILPGAHSDIGGGYPDLHTEELLLHPTLIVRGSDTRSPRQTMEWDNLESLRETVESENWIGPHSLPLPDGTLPYLKLETRVDRHPLPDGRVEISLRMSRQVRGEYSRLGLRLMHQLASDLGIPLDEVDETDPTMSILDELSPTFKRLSEQVSTGESQPVLASENHARLKQRYIHHSDHYNPLEWLIAGEILGFEFPFQEWLHPLRPSVSRERTIHYNRRHG